MPEILLTIKQVAEVLAVSVRTLESMIARGEAPKFVRISRSRRWEQQELAEWIRQHRSDTPRPGEASFISSKK